MEENVTYLITHEDGTKKKITVPIDWKVTFGPAVRGENKGNRYNTTKMPLALRFYADDKRQRAIFTDVISFRDMSIKIEEERVSVQSKMRFMEVDGARKNVNVNAETREWIDPDADTEEPLILLNDLRDIDLDN